MQILVLFNYIVHSTYCKLLKTCTKPYQYGTIHQYITYFSQMNACYSTSFIMWSLLSLHCLLFHLATRVELLHLAIAAFYPVSAFSYPSYSTFFASQEPSLRHFQYHFIIHYLLVIHHLVVIPHPSMMRLYYWTQTMS